VLEDGTVQVFVGTGALVDGDRTHPLQSDPGGAGLPVSWQETGAAISTSSLGGRIGGLAKLLGTEAPDLRSRISSLAEEVFNAVNTIHTGGTDLDGNPGGDFFTLDGPPPFSINSMQVNPAFDADLDLIAAAQGGGPGDGSNALEISKLATGETPGGVQVMEYHRQTLAELGVATSTAEQMQDNQEVILQDLHRKRDAVSGVSLDEELTNLVEAEHAYQAAARLVKTMDSCLNTIVNELGFAGH
jgi:flagellar hook-associated protein 1 FlgK